MGARWNFCVPQACVHFARAAIDGGKPTVSPAVTRQQMGHSDARMTTLYTGEIPLKDVQVAFSRVAYRGEKPQMENDGKWEAA
jgi:hypothetical protein